MSRSPSSCSSAHSDNDSGTTSAAANRKKGGPQANSNAAKKKKTAAGGGGGKNPLVFLLNTSNTRYHIVRDAAIRLRILANANGIQGGWAVEDDGRRDVPRRYWKHADCVRIPRKKVNPFGGVSGGGGPPSSSSASPPAVGGSLSSSGVPQQRRPSAAAVSKRPPSSSSASQQQQRRRSNATPSGDNNANGGSDDDNDDADGGDGDASAAASMAAYLNQLWADEGSDLTKHSKGHYGAIKAKEAQRRADQRRFLKAARGGGGGGGGRSSSDDDDDESEGEEGLGMTEKQYNYVLKRHGGAARYDPARHSAVFWTDLSVLPQRVGQLKAWQRLNHFPEMHLIARKMNLFQRLCKIARTHAEVFPKNYFDFFPLSWSSRTERKQLEDFVIQLQIAKKPKTFLMKPNNGCQGRGIILTRNPIAEMNNATSRSASSFSSSKNARRSGPVGSGFDPTQDYTIQLYVHRPLLIDGRKFDMRVYVLILSLNNPMPHIFIHKEGLVRMASQIYQKPTPANYKKATMHLTNYAVNKKEVKEAFAAAGAKNGGNGGDGNVKTENSNRDERGGESSSPPPSSSAAASPSSFMPTDDSSGDVGFKRDFVFLEKFVDSNCRSWVEGKRKGGDDDEDDGGGEEGADDGNMEEESTITAEEGAATTATTTVTAVTDEDDRLASTSGKNNKSASVGNDNDYDDDADADDGSSRPPPRDGITPYISLLQRVDKAVTMTVLSALPELQQSMASSSVGYLTPQLVMGGGGPSSSSSSSGGGLMGGRALTQLGNRAPLADGRQCFELLGFDILVTEAGRTHVLEVNHSPSLFCESALDQRIKEKVLADIFTLLQPSMLDAGKSSGSGPGAVSGDERYAREMTDLYYNTTIGSSVGGGGGGGGNGGAGESSSSSSTAAKEKARNKIAKSYSKVAFRQVHPVPNSVSDEEKSRGYPHGAGPFLFHRSNASPSAVVFTHHRPPTSPNTTAESSSSGNTTNDNTNTNAGSAAAAFASSSSSAPTSAGRCFSPTFGFSPSSRDDINTRIDEMEATFGLTATVPMFGPLSKSFEDDFSDGEKEAILAQEFERRQRNVSALGPFAVYDGFADKLPYDPCYHNPLWGRQYAKYCRCMYDTVMVSSGLWRGYKNPRAYQYVTAAAAASASAASPSTNTVVGGVLQRVQSGSSANLVQSHRVGGGGGSVGVGYGGGSATFYTPTPTESSRRTSSSSTPPPPPPHSSSGTTIRTANKTPPSSSSSSLLASSRVGGVGGANINNAATPRTTATSHRGGGGATTPPTSRSVVGGMGGGGRAPSVGASARASTTANMTATARRTIGGGATTTTASSSSAGTTRPQQPSASSSSSAAVGTARGSAYAAATEKRRLMQQR